MGDRGLKTRTTLATTVEIRLAHILDELSRETRIPKSKLIDEAIELLAQKHGKKV